VERSVKGSFRRLRETDLRSSGEERRMVRRGRPILVTGIYRSGTTWVSRVIAASGAAGYLWEPFSPLHRPGICDAKFPYWFPYVGPENESPYRPSIEDMLAFRYKTWAEIRKIRSPKDVGRLLRDRLRFARYRRRQMRPLVKDPIAIFSAGWLSDVFDMNVVVLTRHPAAFASSLKKHNLSHPFDHFLQQPLLMRKWLTGFEREIGEFASREHGIVDQAILLWRLIHQAILRYREERPDWMFLRHEDISRDPDGVFRRIFAHVDLDFGQEVRATAQRYSNPTNPIDSPDVSGIERNSSSLVWAWKNRLTQAEIDRIRMGVGEISKEFYDDGEW
jgi:hypothetical protein